MQLSNVSPLDCTAVVTIVTAVFFFAGVVALIAKGILIYSNVEEDEEDRNWKILIGFAGITTAILILLLTYNSHIKPFVLFVVCR